MQPGTQLGHFTVVDAIGRGGMGEVWRAKDTKLGREVAIKTLPSEFASDADRLARFEREAVLLASLNHPNIAAIYGLEEFEGTRFLVLELVEGDTLADRLQRGAIPAEESLKLALQITEALEAAHEKGVVHRDLKPANIKLTPEGRVKVLDFGLAKAFAGEDPEVNPANSPTLSMQATQQGVILGTAAYMSPEQAKGLPADKRADVFAFGCVLYEMLTGHQTFRGELATEILASVINQEPDYSALAPKLHPDIHKLLRRCMDKNPLKRFRDVGDVRFEIEQVLADPAGLFPMPAAPVTAAAQPSRLPWVAGVVISLLAGAAAVWILRPPSEEAGQVMRLAFRLPEEQILSTGASRVSVTRDGTRFMYVANQQLYVRDLDETEARLVSGADDNPIQPVFSPDGEWILYFILNPNRLRKLPVNGGTPLTILEEQAAPLDLDWGTNDQLLFRGADDEGIVQADANGGAREVLIQAENGELLTSPQLLPGENAVLFAANPSGIEEDAAEISVYSLETGERTVLWPSGGSSIRYVPTGHILMAIENTLFALPFDLENLEVRGSPVPVIDGVARAGFSFAANVSVSDDGTLLYVPGLGGSGAGGDFPLAIVDRSGQAELLDLPQGTYGVPRVSPEGRRIAYERTVENSVDIWIYDLSGANQPRQLTFGGVNRYPVWSADGERIAFQSTLAQDAAIFWQVATGAADAERLTTPEESVEHIPDSAASDGELLSFTAIEGDDASVWMLDLESGETSLFAQEPGTRISQSVFSPDSNWVAYQSNETGEDEIFVQPYPATGARYQLPNTLDNHHPMWSPDGTELFYVSVGGQFAVVEVTAGESFEFADPAAIPGASFQPGGPTTKRNTDMLPDGDRFVARGIAGSFLNAAAATDAVNEIRFVINWFSELRERVPVD